jgi:hypothetical protein
MACAPGPGIHLGIGMDNPVLKVTTGKVRGIRSRSAILAGGQPHWRAKERSSPTVTTEITK